MKHVVIALLIVGCGSGPKDPIAQLEDPATCMECHPKHFKQWSGSMHAYASDDPVFVAMNNRGQREAQLGTFCAQCHAPMAVALGRTDFTNFDPATLTPAERGITCYFCHNVDSIKDDHNNGLVVALDDTMHGGAQNPVDSPAHNSTYDDRMHSTKTKSQMCGSCHDVVTPRGVALERTYTEWKASVFAVEDPDPSHFLPQTCNSCHMISSTDVIADKPGLNVGTRAYGFHDHTLAAIDQAMTPFPDTAEQTASINTELEGALTIVGTAVAPGLPPAGGICVEPINGGQIRVRMDTIQVGHMYPSGAAQDRRAWLELVAYDASNAVVFSSGVVPDNKDPEDLADPYLDCTSAVANSCSGFWDRTFKDDNTPAHFFWEVATEVSHLLKPPTTLVFSDPAFDHSTTVTFPIGVLVNQIDHMTARIRTRPFTYAVLDDLVTSGDLAPALATTIPTLDASGTNRTWNRATAVASTGCNP